MSKMTFTSPRATLEETLAFANAVREAGGGNPLDALMPAVPQDGSQCLIAKNLNFNCVVNSTSIRMPNSDSWVNRETVWYMEIADNPQIVRKIAEELGLDLIYDRDPAYENMHAVILPPEIGRVAEAFDEWIEIMDDALAWVEEMDESGDSVDEHYVLNPHLSDDAKEHIEEFWPFVDQSTKEAYDLATCVNDEGEIVL